MNAVTFHVPGKPQGKARAKTVRNKHTGKTMSYTPETDLLYENYRWISLTRGYLMSGECLPVEVSNGVSGQCFRNGGIKQYIANIGF